MGYRGGARTTKLAGGRHRRSRTRCGEGAVNALREVPRCGLRLYSAAASSSCPACGASLVGAQTFVARVNKARTICREYPCTPSSIAKARHALDAVRADIGDSRHRVARLLVSELVTNSVKHSKATHGVIKLVVCLTDSVVRVEVSDDGQGFDTPEATANDAESGRGLELVRELCDRWGTACGLRTCVWFELELRRLRPELGLAASATP